MTAPRLVHAARFPCGTEASPAQRVVALARRTADSLADALHRGLAGLRCTGFAAMVCLLAAGLAPLVAQGAETQDQLNAPAWTGGAVNVTPGNAVSQVVVPQQPVLTAVALALKTGNRGRGGDKLTLTVLNAAGKPLATVSASVTEGFDDWLRFTLPGTGLAVTPQQPLTLRLQDTGKNVFWWKYKGGNTYVAGGALFGGKAFADNDFLFKTFGTTVVVTPGFSLAVSPDPLNVTAGQTQALNLTVNRVGGFNASVTVTFSGLPSVVVANPASVVIPGGSGKTKLETSATASVGKFTVTAKGVATGATATATKTFTLNVAAAPPSCAQGQSLCGGRCVDTRSDVANCGACGKTCSAGAQCTAGACVAAPVTAKCGSGTCAVGEWCCQNACRKSTDGGSCPYQGSSAEYYCGKGTHACYAKPGQPTTPNMNCCCSDSNGAVLSCPGTGR